MFQRNARFLTTLISTRAGFPISKARAGCSRGSLTPVETVAPAMAGRIGPVSSPIVRTRNGAGNSAVLIGASDPFANRHPSKPLRGFDCQTGNHSPQGNVDLDSFDHGGRTNAGPTSPFPCAKELVFPATGYPPPAKPSGHFVHVMCYSEDRELFFSAGGWDMPDFIRADIEHRCRQVWRLRGEIRQLRHSGISSASAEALLDRMLNKIAPHLLYLCPAWTCR